MSYDATQSKTAIETGPVDFFSWLLQDTEGIHWDENSFSYREWLKQYADSIICDWSIGEQFVPMIPQIGSGGGNTTGAYNNGFNSGFAVGLRLKRC